MNSLIAWDDLRIVAAIADAGSLSGAGRHLKLSHATVFRRLNEIEHKLGVTLFDRHRSGYTQTLAGEEMAQAGHRVASEVVDLERRVVGRDLRPHGPLRITTTDTLLTGLLAPLFTKFRQAYPDITLEVAVSNDVFDLSKREADIAIRPASKPPETLVGRRVSSIAQAAYAHTDLVPHAQAKAPSFIDFPWIGPDERMMYRALERWMTHQNLTDRCHVRIDTLLGIYATVRAGAGAAVLPCYLGQIAPDLVPISATISILETDLWILTHPDLHRVTRVRVFNDFLASEIAAHEPDLQGASLNSPEID